MTRKLTLILNTVMLSVLVTTCRSIPDDSNKLAGTSSQDPLVANARENFRKGTPSVVAKFPATQEWQCGSYPAELGSTTRGPVIVRLTPSSVGATYQFKSLGNAVLSSGTVSSDTGVGYPSTVDTSGLIELDYFRFYQDKLYIEHVIRPTTADHVSETVTKKLDEMKKRYETSVAKDGSGTEQTSLALSYVACQSMNWVDWREVFTLKCVSSGSYNELYNTGCRRSAAKQFIISNSGIEFMCKGDESSKEYNFQYRLEAGADRINLFAENPPNEIKTSSYFNHLSIFKKDIGVNGSPVRVNFGQGYLQDCDYE